MSGHFLTELDTRHRGAHKKELCTDLVYECAAGRVFTIPRGFVCDGASVPRFLWSFYPAFGDAYEPAAWLHDWLYAMAETIRVPDPSGAMRSIGRKEADRLFKEAALACGFRGSGAATMHAGVRAGGWPSWNKYRAKAAKARKAGK